MALKRKRPRYCDDDELCAALKDIDEKCQIEMCRRIRDNGQIDLLLEALGKLSLNDDTFKIGSETLQFLKEEFVMMGHETLQSYLSKWIEMIQMKLTGLRNLCLLLKQLIYSVDILQNRQLISHVKTVLPSLHNSIIVKKQNTAAAVISECLCYIMIVESSYSDDCDEELLLGTWNTMLESKESRCSPILLLCSVLVACSLECDTGDYLEQMLKQLAHLKEETDEDPLFCYKKQFFTLLERNISAVLMRCNRKQATAILQALVDHRLSKKSMQKLMHVITDSPELMNTIPAITFSRLFLCLLRRLSQYMEVNEDNSSLEKYLEKCIELMDFDCDASEVDLHNTLETIKLFPGVETHRLLKSDFNFEQIIRVLIGDGFEIELVPLGVRLALFNVLMVFVSAIPSSFFVNVLDALLLIIRSNIGCFRTLLNQYDMSLMEDFVVFVLHNGYICGESKQAQSLVKEIVLSAVEETFFIKLDWIMSSITNNLPVIQQLYHFEALSSVLYEYCAKLKPEGVAGMRKYCKKVIQCLHKLSSPLDSTNMVKLSIFNLSLRFMFVLLQIKRANGAEFDEDLFIGEQIKAADELCKVICKHPLRMTKLRLEKEFLVHTIQTSLSWLSRRQAMKSVTSWKCIESIADFQPSLLGDVVENTTVDLIRGMLNTSSYRAPDRTKIEFYSALLHSTNDAKRKIAISDLDNVLLSASVFADRDTLFVLVFMKDLLAVSGGIQHESDVVTLTLALISTLLKSDCTKPDQLELFITSLHNCLRYCSHSIVNDQCALFAKLSVEVVKMVQNHVKMGNESPMALSLSYGLAKIAHLVVSHKKTFARIAPLLISECLDNAKFTSLALYKFFTICDRYSIALLTTNLPFLQKAKFSHLYTLFKKSNSIAV